LDELFFSKNQSKEFSLSKKKRIQFYFGFWTEIFTKRTIIQFSLREQTNKREHTDRDYRHYEIRHYHQVIDESLNEKQS